MSEQMHIELVSLFYLFLFVVLPLLLGYFMAMRRKKKENST